jgi:hypothetical protein
MAGGLNRDEAVERAVRLARQRGRDLDRYEAPEAQRTGKGWTVFFAGKVPAPGNHFSVHVDEHGEPELRPGR